VEECERLNAQQYYASPHDNNLVEALKNGGATIEWRSPIETQFAANNVARADVFPSERGRSAPTVLILHALMSASRVGYRRCAERFNELGWNACFIHLPYHYSRVPTFPSELTDPQRTAMRRGASTVCCGRVRLDRATRTDRDDPAKMAWL